MAGYPLWLYRGLPPEVPEDSRCLQGQKEVDDMVPMPVPTMRRGNEIRDRR